MSSFVIHRPRDTRSIYLSHTKHRAHEPSQYVKAGAISSFVIHWPHQERHGSSQARRTPARCQNAQRTTHTANECLLQAVGNLMGSQRFSDIQNRGKSSQRSHENCNRMQTRNVHRAVGRRICKQPKKKHRSRSSCMRENRGAIMAYDYLKKV